MQLQSTVVTSGNMTVSTACFLACSGLYIIYYILYRTPPVVLRHRKVVECSTDCDARCQAACCTGNPVPSTPQHTAQAACSVYSCAEHAATHKGAEAYCTGNAVPATPIHNSSGSLHSQFLCRSRRNTKELRHFVIGILNRACAGHTNNTTAQAACAVNGCAQHATIQHLRQRAQSFRVASTPIYSSSSSLRSQFVCRERQYTAAQAACAATSCAEHANAQQLRQPAQSIRVPSTSQYKGTDAACTVTQHVSRDASVDLSLPDSRLSGEFCAVHVRTQVLK